MNALNGLIKTFDQYQQRHRWLAFPIAVVKKFGDDQAGNLAALIAYYGFLSLFPLLLVMVAVLGLVLRNDPELQQRIIDSALAQFPVIGEQLRHNIKVLTEGAGVALGLGTLGALWAGLGVTQAAQNAFNSVWNVPRRERPNFIQSRVRGLITLAVLGILFLGSTLFLGVATAGGPVLLSRVISIGGALVINLALYLVAFKVLTDVRLTWSNLLPGAAFGAVAWTALQSLGSYIVQHQLRNASALYGTFGLIIVLLGWIYLGAQVTLYAAEINVVKAKRLWPRSMIQPPLAEADRRTLEHVAKEEERIGEERIHVRTDERATRPSPHEDRADHEPLGGPATSERAAPSDRVPTAVDGHRSIGRVGATGLGALVALVLARPRRPRP